MSLLWFFEWCEQLPLSVYIRDSNWLFPVIESVHLIALALIGGAILLVDLRLLGVLFQSQPVARLERDSHPWLVGSLIVMIVTGILLFLSEAIKCYYSMPFRIKIAALVIAMIFSLTFRRSVTTEVVAHGGWRMRLTAVTSLLLWGTVAWAGRWIGFSG